MKYYNIKRLLSKYPDAYYYVVFGERSNGKTYSALDYALERAAHDGEHFAYIRRYSLEVKKREMSQLFAAHMVNKRIQNLTKNQWTGISFTGNSFRFSRGTDKSNLEYSDPIGFAFDLNSMEHFKSISFPKVTTIIFDEFITRSGYLPNEFLLFTNVLSTIIRTRNNVKIIMLGNTVNKFCPYFGEMGLTHVKEQKQGTVDVYRYANSDLKVVVEYCSSTLAKGGKKSDVYFAFNNPQLQMITTGAWEIAVYPPLPCKYKPKDIAVSFFVEFDKDILQADLVTVPDQSPFIFIHIKTTPIRKPTDLVYGQVPSASPYRMVGFNDKVPLNDIVKSCVRAHRIFFATNESGEIWRNYLQWLGTKTL